MYSYSLKNVHPLINPKMKVVEVNEAIAIQECVCETMIYFGRIRVAK